MKWPVTSLGNVLSLEYGAPLKAANRDAQGTIPVAGSNGINGYHTEALVKGPGIVVGRKGSAGKVTWFDSDFWAIDTTFYVRPKIKANLRWLFYLLKSLNLEELAIVTGVPGLNRNDAYKSKITLPPPSEQQRIVELLDQADALRKKRALANNYAARILPAFFIKMLGDPVSNQMGWETPSLGDKTDIVYGLAEKLSLTDTVETGVPIVRISNVLLNGELDLSNMRYWQADDALIAKLNLQHGDLLFNWRNGSPEHIGKTAIWEDQLETAIFVSFLLRIRCGNRGFRPYYLWAYMNLIRADGFFSRTSRMQINRKFNATELGQLKVPMPPVKLQEAFESKLLSLRKVQIQRQASAEKIESLFSSLLHRAFSGELTAKWREAHMKELLAEMEIQKRELGVADKQKALSF
jgi:type I restriction enzyme S subunit